MSADAERGIGRPERALELFSEGVTGLAPANRVELLIVASGARADMGDHQAALLMLEVAELDAAPESGSAEVRQARARLISAYADALDAVGRSDEAQRWLQRAAAADLDGSTGARERLDDGGIDIVDLDLDADAEADAAHGEADERGGPDDAAAGDGAAGDRAAGPAGAAPADAIPGQPGAASPVPNTAEEQGISGVDGDGQ